MRSHSLLVTVAAVGLVALVAAAPADAHPAPTPTPRGTAWVPVLFEGDGLVSVVDLASGAVTATIDDGIAYPYATSLSPNGRLLYVTELFAADVAVVNTATRTVVDHIAVGAQPNGVAFSPNGKFAYVTSSVDDSVSVIDVIAGELTSTITVGDNPVGVAVSRDGKQVYTANYGDASASVITVATGAVASATVGTKPVGIAVGERGRVFVANSESSSVSVLDGRTGAAIVGSPIELEPGATPEGIAARGNEVYVGTVGAGSLTVLDGRSLTVKRTLGLGGVWAVAPAGGDFVVAVQPGAPSVLNVVNSKTGAVVSTTELGTLALGLGNFVGR